MCVYIFCLCVCIYLICHRVFSSFLRDIVCVRKFLNSFDNYFLVRVCVCVYVFCLCVYSFIKSRFKIFYEFFLLFEAMCRGQFGI